MLGIRISSTEPMTLDDIRGHLRYWIEVRDCEWRLCV